MEKRTLVLSYGLIVSGILARLLPHPANVTPLVAVALFSSAVLPRRVALIIPLAIMMISDWLIGFDPQLPFNWAAFIVVGCVGFLLRDRRSVPRLAGVSLVSSALFFLISNFGVWAVGRLYPVTAAGLRACYVAGIPFFRQMAAGDLVFTGICFGLFALARKRQCSPVIAYSK